MAYGMPYVRSSGCLFGEPDYQGLCDGFFAFYSQYYYPYGVLAVTDCRELEALAETVRAKNEKAVLFCQFKELSYLCKLNRGSRLGWVLVFFEGTKTLVDK